MALDASDVVKIAHLARLGIDAEDIPEYTRNLSAILAFVEQLNAVDTAGVEPLAIRWRPSSGCAPMRSGRAMNVIFFRGLHRSSSPVCTSCPR